MKTLTKATIVTAAAATVLTGGYFYMQPLTNHSDTQAVTDPSPLASPSDTPSSTTVTTTPDPAAPDTPAAPSDTTQTGNNPQAPATLQADSPSPTPVPPISGGLLPNSGRAYPDKQ